LTRRPKVLELLRRGTLDLEKRIGDDLSWAVQGRCVGKDPELFFGSSASQVSAAKAICSDCPVRRSCLEFAVSGNETGVWGGTTESERLQAFDVRPRELRVTHTEVADFLTEFLNWDLASLSRKYEVDSRTVLRWRKEIKEGELAKTFAKVG
jgi:hypothetical protein